MTNWRTFSPAGTRERRTFAEIVRVGKTDHIPHDASVKTPKPIIVLQPDIEINNKMRKILFVGEALSLTHLGNLPKLFALKETLDFGIKCIGGLKILLVFEHSVGAKSFLEKQDR